MRNQVEKKSTDKDKSNSAVEVKEAGPQKEQSFWVLLEVKLNEVLTPNEVVKFIAEMKKVIDNNNLLYFIGGVTIVLLVILNCSFFIEYKGCAKYH